MGYAQFSHLRFCIWLTGRNYAQNWSKSHIKKYAISHIIIFSDLTPAGGSTVGGGGDREIVGAQVRYLQVNCAPSSLLSGDSPCHNTVQVGADTSLIKVAIRETPDHATYRGKRVLPWLVRHKYPGISYWG